MKKLILCLMLILPLPLTAIVGSVVSGQSLWWMVKRIGQTSDIIESKLDALKACEETVLTSANISGSTISITTPGTYQLGEDVTAGISIQASCVLLNLDNRIVTGNVVVEALNTDVTIENGTFIWVDEAAGANFVIIISSGCHRAVVRNVTIHSPAATTKAGGVGMVIGSGEDVQIIGCTIRGGDGAAATTGFAGGRGIQVNGTRTLIRDCIIYSGAGGNGTDSPDADGGDGGNAIHIEAATDVEIDGCIIMATGAGGDGDGAGTPGDGGDGIRVLSDCTDVAVHDCIIRDTGAAGTGGSGGSPVGGKAIFDSVTTVGSLSVFLRNFAHNIANSIKYDFQAGGIENGTLVANPPDNTVLSEPNQFVNAYMS